MKYIIIGLGKLGSAIAAHLTSLRHEVIGVDMDLHIVDEYKSTITDTICLNSTDVNALKVLPLKDVDAVLITLGGNVGDSLLTTAIIKKTGVKKLIVRALSSVHETILESLGVDEIITPEKESGIRFARHLEFQGIVDSLIINKEHEVIVSKLPKQFVGQSVKSINFQSTFNLNLIGVNRNSETQDVKAELILGFDDLLLEKGDELIFIGSLYNYRKFQQLF